MPRRESSALSLDGHTTSRSPWPHQCSSWDGTMSTKRGRLTPQGLPSTVVSPYSRQGGVIAGGQEVIFCPPRGLTATLGKGTVAYRGGPAAPCNTRLLLVVVVVVLAVCTFDILESGGGVCKTRRAVRNAGQTSVGVCMRQQALGCREGGRGIRRIMTSCWQKANKREIACLMCVCALGSVWCKL